MKITKSQIRQIIKEEIQTVQAHSDNIVNMFLDDVIQFVRTDIVPEQAPAIAGMTVADLLQAAADRARKQNPRELACTYRQ